MRITILIALVNLARVWTDDDMEGRIVNGKLARVKNHPHSVYLFMHEPYKAHVCGASIVNQRVILSAAHCFEGVTKIGKIVANVGSTHLNKGRKYLVKSVRMHPKYDMIKISNDIALAGLEKPIVFGLKTKRIAIARQKRSEGMAKLAGWGIVREYPHYEHSNYLHEVAVHFMSREKCKKIFSKMEKGTFCGGELNSKSHPSVGDSGSPLVFKNYMQIGLVSFKNNDISKSMIVYTDVPYFYKWIEENAKTVYCKNKFNIPNFYEARDQDEEDYVAFSDGR